MHNVINELRDQLGRLDVNATVDFQELQRVISDQKNVRIRSKWYI
jgi:SAM-dependent MidA family methyltransferase